MASRYNGPVLSNLMKVHFLTPLFAALVCSLSAAEPIEIFNGKDLTGWEGNLELWSVKDGAITGITPPDPANPEKGVIKHNTFLVWKGGTVSDFELTFQYKIVKGNSGVQYRSKELEAGEFGPILSGYQADFEAGDKYSGILYEEKGRGILALRGEKTVIKPAADASKKPVVEKQGIVGDSDAIQASIKKEDWNEYKIVAQGNHVQHFINGLQTVDVTDEDAANAPKEGVLGLQIHQGPPMMVQFKNFKMISLK
ncbi:protein of unknown function [Prosthecobacter debontii]|uniref:3-keto-alpha-glucoside-1,2-lyase/3-keto-2-hydroxy-glucal hydratase domain-containing protein n=2 Tax=Prosthecobacter debontii TaxID=48467 RepID=A0A1T4YNX9_9BACT|nr:protein of unknown function [Prosthecobacter debontii]